VLVSIRVGDEDEIMRDARRYAQSWLWCPQYLTYDVDGPVAHALFPGYAFGRLGDGWQRTMMVRGVYGVVHFGEETARVPEQVITELKAMCGPSGYVRLAPRFNRWARVRLEGSSNGLPGIVQERVSATAVKVLFEILGRKVEMSVPDRGLVAA
jgi:hypothetical protein